jgi:glycosyltransferase involved in cell wall biosynthesis
MRDNKKSRAASVLYRTAVRLPKRVRKQFVIGAKIAWWTFTGQLPSRWQAWKKNRQSVSIYSIEESIESRNETISPQRDEKRWINRIGPVVLIVDDRWPEPDRDSGSMDAMNLVRNLYAMGFEIAYAVASDINQDVRYRDDLTAAGARPLNQNGFASIQKYISDNGQMFSLVILTRVTCGGALFEHVKYYCPDAKVIFNTVDLHFLRELRAAKLAGDKQAIDLANQTRDREEWLVSQVDLTIVVSEAEQGLLATSVPRAPVIHLPLNRKITLPSATFSARNGVGFVGGFNHLPNIDAINWFLNEIWPLVRRVRPDLMFSIAGSNLPQGIARKSDNVDYLGPVVDLHAWFETLIMSVAPLRIGAGAKGKVASSLASGLPCVLTTVAAEGMNLIDGENVLVADTPELFADRIIELVGDEGVWKRLSVGALKSMEKQLSDKNNFIILNEAIIKLGVPVPNTKSSSMSKEQS